MQRSLAATILHERQSYQKMIFIAGPRQVGKTTVLNQVREYFPGPILNWDSLEDRLQISKGSSALFENSSDIYFDEIHKYPRWKNFLKGNFDKYGDNCRIYVTGSARLDVYRRGGDSMMGRYLLFHLHPFTVGELLKPDQIPREISISELLDSDSGSSIAAEAWDNLKVFGGFPEPFLSQKKSFHRRWLSMKNEKLVREDIRDMSRIRELALLEQMIALIPGRVGQPFSLNALREDLEVSHDSIRLWTGLLEEFYYLFLVPAYSKKIARSSKKERKLYLWDYSELNPGGPKFENMIASHLLKWSHVTRDFGYKQIEIFFIKDKEKREVDFLVTEERKPVLLIEAMTSDQKPTESSIRFSSQLGDIPIVQVVDEHNVFVRKSLRGGKKNIEWVLMSASNFCQSLP